jgi:hypothetical protein
MVWFFERGGGVLELVTRYDNDTAEYVLELRPAGAAPTSERFRDRAAYKARLLAVEQQLTSEQWRPNGPPVLLPDGWPDRTPFW